MRNILETYAVDRQQQMVTAWAAGTLQMYGATLFATKSGWDVEFPDGSWRAANSPLELSAVATELVELAFKTPEK